MAHLQLMQDLLPGVFDENANSEHKEAYAADEAGACDAGADVTLGAAGLDEQPEEDPDAWIPVPAYLRGSVRKIFILQFKLKQRIQWVVDNYEGVGMRNLYGFQSVANGATECAVDGLVSDLTGCDSARNKTEDELIVQLHEEVFTNFNQWARFVKAGTVYSAKYDDYDKNPTIAMITQKQLKDPNTETVAESTPADAAGLATEVPGQDIPTRLNELVLWYAIRAETANLRFMPEMTAWMFHQMRSGYEPPSWWKQPADAEINIDTPNSFHKTTVVPLYNLVKAGSKKTQPYNPGILGRLGCCHRTGNSKLKSNSERINYDDANEYFWDPSCLKKTWHNESQETGCQTIKFYKTFREKASYIALFLSFWRIAVYLVVAFQGLSALARNISLEDGTDVVDLPRVFRPGRLMTTIQDIIVECTLAYVGMHLAHVVLAGIHSLPSINPGFLREFKRHISWTEVCKPIYAIVWFALFMFFSSMQPAHYDSLFLAQFCGILLVRGALGLIGNHGGNAAGRDKKHRGGCSWLVKTRIFLFHMERVRVLLPTQRPSMLGPHHMVQPIRRVIVYALIWIFLLICKGAFDLHVLIKQHNLLPRLVDGNLEYQWDIVVGGYHHIIIVLGTWSTMIVLYLLDSYIFFILGAGAVGTVVLRKDGIGAVHQAHDLKRAFKHGISSLKSKPLAEQFVTAIIPAAKQEGIKASHVFARAWDAFISSLRKNDLISNEEQCLLMYGDAVLGVEPRMPLFMYAGKVLDVISRSHRWIPSIRRGMEVQDMLRVISGGDDVAADAILEIVIGLPPLITQVCRSHSCIGFHDPHIAKTIESVFSPGENQTMCDYICQLISNSQNPAEQLMEFAGLVVRFCLEFEKQNASTRLLGNPLVEATVRLLALLQRLRGEKATQLVPEVNIVVADAGTAIVPAHHFEFSAENMAVSHIMSLERLPSVPEIDTRSLDGIIRCLVTPNEATGRLDGVQQIGDSGHQLQLESLAEISRRVYYLITMERAHAVLKVPEADRRIQFFIQSLYMRQMPTTQSVLDMMSFSAVTPIYGEAIIYERNEYLCKVDDQTGIAPMVYLKTMYKEQWENLLERLGCENETQAWAARADACGNPINGELEVRLWASRRGQTLGRAISGVLEYARGIRILATIELELEYAALEAALPDNMKRTAEEISEEAFQAANWFTAQRVAYICACQRYSEHGPEEVRKRVQIDVMLMHYPLLKVVYFDFYVDANGKKKLRSVCKQGANIKYFLPMPGHPIQDGIGEGKPENQNNSQPYQFARIIQTLDMNQDFFLEEAFKLPNALKFIGRQKDVTGRVVASVGLREHIFSCYDGAPALFMSQGEYVFAVMWQRMMASPFRVRMHYGHPDMWDKVYMQSRGGTAKASQGIHVSEDIFAGFTTALRGSESEHIEFLQLAKGKDTGFLQVAMFEAKISGGSAIAFTSRDAMRLCEGLDFFRLMSYFHTGAGFFLSNLMVIVSLMCMIYYLAGMSISGLDAAVLASNHIYLIGDLTPIEWIAQLGLLTVIPLYMLYWLEFGFWWATKMTLYCFIRMSTVFFMFGIQTKAYYFDAGLTFGSQSYLATGRNFVLKHLRFTELFRAIAHSHFYVGFEVLILLLFISFYGTYATDAVYAFYTTTSWLFALSNLFGASWFNPLQFELKHTIADIRDWLKWMNTPDGSAEQSWSTWWASTCLNQYAQVSMFVRIIRVARISRLLVPAFLLSGRSFTPTYRYDDGLNFWLPPLVLIGLALALTVGFQVLAMISEALGCDTRAQPAASGHGHGAPAAPADGGAARVPMWRMIIFGPHPFNRLFHVAFVGFALAAVISLLLIKNPDAGIADGINALFSFFFTGFWVSRVIDITNCRFLKKGNRGVHKTIDAFVGGTMLLILLIFAAIIPFGRSIHTALLFGNSYAAAVEVLSASHNMLGIFSTASSASSNAPATDIRTDRDKHDTASGIIKRFTGGPVRTVQQRAHDRLLAYAAFGDDAKALMSKHPDNNIGYRTYKLWPITALLKNAHRLDAPVAGPTASSTMPAAVLAAPAEEASAFSTINIPMLAGLLPAEEPPAPHEKTGEERSPAETAAGSTPEGIPAPTELKEPAQPVKPKLTLNEIMAQHKK